jgi:hypothetical protein
VREDGRGLGIQDFGPGDAGLSQQVMIEALYQEIIGVLGKFDEALPLASVVGVLEVIKYQLLNNTSEEDK